MDYFTDFAECRVGLADMLLNSNPVEVGEWQSKKQTAADPMGVTFEIQNCVFQYAMPRTPQEAQLALTPNLPWAEDHFRERVGGEPLNPPPSERYWPFAQQGNADHKDGGDGEIFSHTYPERFWPKQAGDMSEQAIVRSGARRPEGFGVGQGDFRERYVEHADRSGIRYKLGDLRDVMLLLERSPKTRQAYLPVWFPEDTGNVSEVRVPCTLGYLFQYRPPTRSQVGGEFHITYLIRSCDFVRHFTDDCYMAIRLAQWMLAELAQRQERIHSEEGEQAEGHPWWRAVTPGLFTFHAMSLHAFGGDAHYLKKLTAQAQENRFSRGGVVYDLSKLN